MVTAKPHHCVATLVFSIEKSTFPFKKGMKVKTNLTVKTSDLRIVGS